MLQFCHGVKAQKRKNQGGTLIDVSWGASIMQYKETLRNRCIRHQSRSIYRFVLLCYSYLESCDVFQNDSAKCYLTLMAFQKNCLMTQEGNRIRHYLWNTQKQWKRNSWDLDHTSTANPPSISRSQPWARQGALQYYRIGHHTSRWLDVFGLMLKKMYDSGFNLHFLLQMERQGNLWNSEGLSRTVSLQKAAWETELNYIKAPFDSSLSSS